MGTAMTADLVLTDWLEEYEGEGTPPVVDETSWGDWAGLTLREDELLLLVKGETTAVVLFVFIALVW